MLKHRCLLLCAVLLLARSGAALQRRVLLRNIPGWDVAWSTKHTCINTGSGRLYMADNRGYVCSRDQMDFTTGCCKGGTQHNCELCKLTDKCCSEYEHCVSCCLGPHHEAAKLYSLTPRAPKLPSAGTWGSAWEYCRGVCRTHSFSTMHENAYISTRHHCFSNLGKPMMSDPLPAGALDGLTVLLSSAGDSCDEACSKRSLACSKDHLSLMNSCDRLREQIGCEAGCEAGNMPGGSAPAYIDSSAPKASRPAMCFTAVSSDALNCSGKDAQARRLCICKSA